MPSKALIILIFSILSVSAKSQHLEIGRSWVDTLSSPYFFGRGYVKDGVNKAAEFIKNEFEKMGIHKLPGADSYLQDFSFGVNTFPGVVAVKHHKRELINGVHFMVNPNSGGGEFKKLKLTHIDTVDINDEKQLKNKLDLAFSKKSDGVLFDLSGMPVLDEMNLKYQLLGLGNHFPTVFVTSNKMDWGVGRAQLKYPVLSIADSIFQKNKLFSLCIKAEWEPDFTSKNVMGYIPSLNKDARTIVFTAHYDHLGGMGNEVFIPGANDNASGTSMLAAIAQHFLREPSQDHLVFIAVAGEEAGLLGSEHFVESNIMGLDSIRIVLNLDLMGSGEKGITIVNGTIFKEEFDLFQRINQEKNYVHKIKPRGETQNSDHYHFYKKGVPAFFIYTLGAYTHYHDIYDCYENLPFSAYDEIVNLLIDFVNLLD
jgi:aminopeptidase YwaD